MKVHIYQTPIGQTEIFFIREGFGGKISIAKPIVLEWVEVDSSAHRVEPSLMISIDPEFMPSLANAVSGAGVKTESDHKILGVLEATKYHLEDMRKLAFKDVDTMTSRGNGG